MVKKLKNKNINPDVKVKNINPSFFIYTHRFKVTMVNICKKSLINKLFEKKKKLIEIEIDIYTGYLNPYTGYLKMIYPLPPLPEYISVVSSLLDVPPPPPPVACNPLPPNPLS